MDVVWSYWEGEMSPFQRLCLDTIEKHNTTFRLLTPDTFRQIEGAEKVWQHCEGAETTRRSDVIRAFLLSEFGGIWTDADVISLAPFDLLDDVPHYDLICVCNRPANVDKVVSTPFGGRAASAPLVYLFHETMELMDIVRSGRSLPYAELSTHALSRVWRQERDCPETKTAGAYRYNPFHWSAARKVYLRCASDTNHESYGSWNRNQISHHLTNQIPMCLAMLTREQCLDHPSFACYLIRKSLGV